MKELIIKGIIGILALIITGYYIGSYLDKMLAYDGELDANVELPNSKLNMKKSKTPIDPTAGAGELLKDPQKEKD